MLLLVTACVLDGALQDLDKPGYDSGAPVDPGLPEETCNGLDDDGDDQIDEGFDDLDGNGRADCVDLTCPDLDAGDAGAVEVDPACVPTIEDPWDIEVEWRYDATGSGVLVTPMVGNLTDDNGDGAIDADDVPDIVFPTEYDSTLVALSGDDGHELFVLPGYAGSYGVAIADVDGDGEAEIIASDTSYHVVALSGEGVVEWTSGDPVAPIAPTVADLDGDGIVEVIGNGRILDGQDGSLVASFDPSYNFDVPVAVDLDEDGVQEVIFHHKCFDPDGGLIWDHDIPWLYSTDYTAIADVDGDGGGDVVSIALLDVHVYDSNGDALGEFPLDDLRPAPPTMADFDGDGAVELAVAANATLAVYELDGTPRWSAAIHDTSGSAASSAYDFDDDGAYELLHADEGAFRIYDGRTGAVLYEDPTHRSQTMIEYPVVADVDHDGSAEIVVASSANDGIDVGITVYGHRGGVGWYPSGPTWGEYAYTTTAIDDDGAVPVAPAPSWRTDNLFRARPCGAPPALPNLTVVFPDSCVADCTYGPIALAVQVANTGAGDAAAGAVLSVYASTDGVETLVASSTLPAIAAGTALGGIEVAVAPGADGWTARVVGAAECDAADNEAWLATTCP